VQVPAEEQLTTKIGNSDASDKTLAKRKDAGIHRKPQDNDQYRPSNSGSDRNKEGSVVGLGARILSVKYIKKCAESQEKGNLELDRSHEDACPRVAHRSGKGDEHAERKKGQTCKTSKSA